MLIRELPWLALIGERLIIAVKSLGVVLIYSDLSLRVFPQVWGSTALGFGGIGGQAMTAAYTTVVEDAYEGFYSVFFGERLAYLIQNPSDVFFADMYKCNMKPVSQAGVYKRGEKS